MLACKHIDSTPLDETRLWFKEPDRVAFQEAWCDYRIYCLLWSNIYYQRGTKEPMPGIGHLVLGMSIVIPLMYLTRKEDRAVSYKIAVIFFINNYIGPDAGHIFRILTGIDFHSLLGFTLFAIPLSLVYSYMSRFSLERSGNWFDIVDDGVRQVDWSMAYLVTLSGGIFHNMLDFLFHHGNHTNLFPFHDIDMEDLLSWGWGPSNDTTWTPWVIISMVLIIFTFLGAWHVFKKGFKDTARFFILVVTVVTIMLIFMGTYPFGGEREPGAIFFSILYVFTPLMLLTFAWRRVTDTPRTKAAIPRISRTALVNAVGIAMASISGLFFTLGLVAVLDPIAFQEVLSFGGESAIMLIGSLLIVVTSIGIFGSIGLFFRNNACRHIIIVIATIMLLLVFPYAVALVLSEKAVKQQFISMQAKSVKEAPRGGGMPTSI